MHKFANPTRFLKLSRALVPWLAGLSALTLIVGLVWGLAFSPPDYQQGDTVRIMYVHVPSAWMGLFAYVVMAAASFVALVWKHPLADLAARAAAPLGAAFTFLCLVTGALWGKPMWGAWWVWDARLTSMLVLLFLYLGYMALANAFDDVTRGNRAAAVLCLVGVVNVPIIKFSVDWWNTLHQPTTVMAAGGPAIEPTMLWPLLIMGLSFKLIFVTLLLLRMESGIAATKVRAIGLREAAG